jgi:phosphate-selective porin OprO and OprP
MRRHVLTVGLVPALLTLGAVDLAAVQATATQLSAAVGSEEKGEAIQPDTTSSTVELSAAPVHEQPELRSPEIIRTENFSLNLGARLQLRGTYDNPDGGNDSGSFTIRRGRLSLGGSAWEHFNYAMQMELAGGSVNIIDANISHQFSPLATLRVGQAKAFFGRQQLNSSGNLHFVDRTIVDGRFSGQRQNGIALHGHNEGRTFEYGVGIHNGNGINTANDNGDFMFAGRAVLTPLGAYSPAESAFDYPESPRVAIGGGFLINTIGNGADEVDITRFNVETAFKIRGLNATAEFYHEDATPTGLESLTTTGWYVQPGFLLPNRRNEVAVRYAVISPDTEADTDQIETGVALSHYWAAHRAKLQADLRQIERKATDTKDLQFRLQIQLTL